MSTLNFSKNVLSTLAGAADAVLSNGVLTITGAPEIKRLDVKKLVLTPSVSETLEVHTLTPTAANNTTYSFVLSQFVPALDKVVTTIFEHTTPTVGGGAATDITAALKSQIDLAPGFEVSVADGATLVITALTGNATFEVSNASDSFASSVNTTPGVASVGQVGDLVLEGIDASLLTTGNSYKKYVITHETIDGASGGVTESSLNTHTVIADEDAANFAAFDSALVAAFETAGVEEAVELEG